MMNFAEIPLKLTLIATKNIEETSGCDISKLSDWINGVDKATAEKLNGEAITTAEKLLRISKIFEHLANGGIMQHNANVALGLEQGEKKPLYPPDFFAAVMTLKDFSQLNEQVWGALGDGMEYTVPDNIKLEEQDEVLAEIEAEKADKTEKNV